MAAELFSDGDAYERLMGRWSRALGKSFLAWLDVPQGQRWLDAGCGNGAFTEELMARCVPAAVTALDPSEGQLAYARKRPGAQAAQFQLGDVEALPFPDKTFDAAVMALVISFLAHPEKAVAEMARVVRPGGWVATYMWDLPDGVPVAPIYRAIEAIGISNPLPPNPAASKRETLHALWKAAGLDAIETEVIRITCVFADFDEFWASSSLPVGTQGQIIARLSPEARQELRERARTLVPIAADGRVAFEAYANAVKGRVPQ